MHGWTKPAPSGAPHLPQKQWNPIGLDAACGDVGGGCGGDGDGPSVAQDALRSRGTPGGRGVSCGFAGCVDLDDPIWSLIVDPAHLPAAPAPAPAPAPASAADPAPAERPQKGNGNGNGKGPVPPGPGPLDAPSGCPYCGSSTIAEHDGNCMCMSCNSLVGRQIDYKAEWRFFGAEDTRTCNPTRCYPPSNGLIQTLGTVVAAAPRRHASHWRNRTEATAAAQQTSASAGRTMQKYQVWSSMSYRDRVLCRVFDQLAVCASQHGLPACILEEAKGLYKRVSEARITRGENRAAVIAVCMYVACKRNGVPRSIREVGEMFSIRSCAMTKATHTVQSVVADADAASSEPSDFLGRFCSRLGMPDHAVRMTRGVVARADELALVCDAMPPSIVGGAILLVGARLGLAIDRDAIAAACVIAPVTVTKMFKRLSQHEAELLLLEA